MSEKIPSLAETCERHWKSVFDAVKILSCPDEQIHVHLVQRPLEDRIHKDYCVGLSGELKEMPSYPVDTFLLYVTAGESPYDDLGFVYLGSGSREKDPDSNGYDYSNRVIGQLRQEIGLRLRRLKSLGRDVYLTSSFLGYDRKEATDKFIDGLLVSDDDVLGIVTESVLG